MDLHRLDTTSDGAAEQHCFSNDEIPTRQPAADFTLPTCDLIGWLLLPCQPEQNCRAAASPSLIVTGVRIESEEGTTPELCAPPTSDMWCNKVYGLGEICCASEGDKHWCILSELQGNMKVDSKRWLLVRNKLFAGMKIQILFLVLLRWHFKF